MKKSELLEILKEIGDDQDINETILAQEDFAKSSDYSNMTLEDFKKVATENKEIKGYLASEKDRAVSKGIDSFKKNNLDKLVEDGIKAKSQEGLTEEQKQIQELLAYKNQVEHDKKVSETKSSYSGAFKEKNLPADLMDYVNFDTDKESIDKSIEKLSKIFSESVKGAVDTKIGDSTYTPQQTSSKNGKVSWADVLENPALMDTWKSQNNQ